MKTVILSILTLFLFVVLIFLAKGLGLISYQFFAPKYENARREVWENTQSYRAGSQRDLENLVLQYHQAKTEDEKGVILSTLRHRVYGMPQDQVPAEVHNLLRGE